jgi:O-methyltransferase involved in polyketide biosynthesis
MKSFLRLLFCLALSQSSSNLHPLTLATNSDNAKIEVDLGAVQETLLIPLIGRAVETKRANGEGLINDPKSVEIVEKLDYDFSHWEDLPSVAGAVLRTRLLDQDVQLFLDKHPTGTVVEIGCGLNDRLNRLRLLNDDSKLDDIRWFDLDFPDTIALRKKFFDYSDEKNRHMIAASVVEYDKWVPQVKAAGGPWLFVSEAVIVYLDEPDVERFFQTIVKEFDHAWVALDTPTLGTMHLQGEHPLMKHLGSASYFRWGCDEPQVTIPQWTNNKLQILQQRTYADAGEELISKAPYPFNTLSPNRKMTVRTIFNIFVTEQDMVQPSDQEGNSDEL